MKTQIIRLFFRLTLPERMDIFRRNPFFLFYTGNLTPVAVYCGNGPFAEYAGHMVQKTPCRMRNNAEGQEKQRDDIIQKTNVLSFQCLTASLPSSKVLFFVTCDRILQRAHYHLRKPHTCTVDTILGSFHYDCLKTVLVLYTCVVTVSFAMYRV